MKKILFVITRSDVFGGANIHLLSLIKEMSLREEYKPILVIGGKGIVYSEALKHNIEMYSIQSLVREISLFKDIKCIYELCLLIDEINPDLLHLHSSKAGAIGRICSIIKGVPCVFTAHGWSFTGGVSLGKRYIYKYIELFLSFFTERIIVVSCYDKDIAINFAKIDCNKISVIHNGVFDHGKPPIGVFDDVIKIAMIARFDQPKNQNLLIDSLSKIKNNRWNLTFAGNGPLLQEVKKKAKKLNISDNINYLGEVDRDTIHYLLNEVDLFVLISNWEGLPLTILEAMERGKPIVASKVGGVNEEVIDGVNGYLVQNDPYEIASKIEMLQSDKSAFLKMGAESRNRFEELFNEKIMYEKTFKIYESVLKKYE